MPTHFHARIHESVALSAVIATSIALNAFWVVNMVSMRLPALQELLAIVPPLGTIGGLYVVAGVVLAASWLILVTLLRGRDCSEYRSNALWLLLVSVGLYLVFTFPPIFNFVVVSNS